MYHLLRASIVVSLLAGPLLQTSNQAAADEPHSSLQGLEWRCVGPHVGNRGCTVAIHPADRNVFFHGHSSGGLWKTVDAGQYWIPISDGQFNVGSVGAMAVSPSHPDIMYVGTGEPQLRDCVSWGDGMYKTTDGGKTWSHIGLKNSRNIARVRIHPTNPDLVYVAVIGNPFGPSNERGVYRTKDGGETWEQVLFQHEQAGAIDLWLCEHDTDILYASTFEIFRRTWGLRAGGPNSRIFKSTDGGTTWDDITQNPGLPEGPLGRISVAHSRQMPDRVSAMVESKVNPGFYQSEDGGKTWQHLSSHVGITQRPFYYYHLHASPHDGNEFWVPSNKLWQSLDGGKTWNQRTGTKDDFHDLAFDPADRDRMIVTHDGGAMCTLNGGTTWSQCYSQPNQQIYRLNVDDQFPYNLYGNCQDLIGFKVPSRSIWGGIPLSEVTVIGSGESGATVPHPTEPDLVYHLAQSTMAAGGAPIQLVNLRTGQWEHRSVWPVITFGRGQDEAKYRFNWHCPIVIDPFDPETVYTAAELVFRSRDRGMSWETISPVLTKDDPSKQKAGGSVSSLETSGQEAYNTIHRMVCSTAKEGIMWTGSDDGLVHVTRDGGQTWTNTNLPVPDDSDVYELEASPHDPATCYVTLSRYRTANDFKPYIFRTTDYGATWKDLSAAFPQDEITRTIREDSVRKGLLFVGTETGVFVSLDDGRAWSRLNMNLPRVGVHDIRIKNGDLCIATHGRSFWILDDISPLRQLSDTINASAAHLFQPMDHTRLGINWWAAYGGGVGDGQKNYFAQNGRHQHTFYELGIVNGEKKRKFLDAGDARPRGAILYYHLTQQVPDLSLEIIDPDGRVVRRYDAEQLPQTPGLHRWIWDMQYPDVVQVPGKPPAGIVVEARPGTYTARLTANGRQQAHQFQLSINPNETWTQEDCDARFALWWKIRSITESANEAIIGAMKLAEQAGPDSEVSRKATEFSGKLVPQGATLSEIANEPSKLLSKLQTVHWVLFHSEGRPTKSSEAVVNELGGQIQAEIDAWNEYRASVARQQ